MGIQSTVVRVDSGRTFNSTKPIADKEHMAVYGLHIADSEWVRVNKFDYDLINNAAVIDVEFYLQQFSFIEVRVADTPEELGASQSAISIVAGIASEVVIVAEINEEVVVVASIADAVERIGTDEALMSSIVRIGTDEPLIDDIENAEENAGLAIAAKDLAEEWSNLPLPDKVDGVHYSSMGYAQIGELLSLGLDIQGTWNPTTQPDPVPADGAPLTSGMSWFVIENSVGLVYGVQWVIGDTIIYTGNLAEPYPYVRRPSIVNWDDIVNIPVTSYPFKETIATEGQALFTMTYNVGSLEVSHNGYDMVKDIDFEEGLPTDGVCSDFTMLTPSLIALSDSIYSKGIHTSVPTESWSDGFYINIASVLTAASYASQPEDEFVIVYTSNGDGTFTETPQTTYSGLHYEAKNVAINAGIVTEGDAQVLRVTTEGNTQDTRVIDEGDTQEARVIAEGTVQIDLAQDQAWIAEAEAMTSESFATEPENTFVKEYTSNGDGTFSETDTSYNSSYHWSEKAKLAAAGLNYLGTWAMDAACTVPPAGTVTGDFYIIAAVDPACTTYAIGDWIVWDDIDSGGDDAWHLIAWQFSWTIANDVTVEGALPAIGDDLARNGTAYTKAEADATAALKFDKTGGDITGVTSLRYANPMLRLENTEGDTHQYIQSSTDRIRIVNSYSGGERETFSINNDSGKAHFPFVPTSTQAPVGVDDLTRKDYVDSHIPQQVTQAEYDALTPDPLIMYAIVG